MLACILAFLRRSARPVRPVAVLGIAVSLGFLTVGHDGIPPAAAEEEAPYLLTDLGTLPGGTESSALAVNERGQVVGFAKRVDGQTRGFFWSGGTMGELGTLDNSALPGGSTATDLNNAGTIVGQSVNAQGGFRAVRWQTPVAPPEDLGALVEGGDSFANAISEAGKIVGGSDGAGGTTRPFLHFEGHMSELLPGVLPGGNAFATDLNASDQIVGQFQNVGGFRRGFLIQGNDLTELPPLTGGAVSAASSINAAGRIAGSAEESTTVTRAVFWAPPGYSAAGVPADTDFSSLSAVNARGEAVGTYRAPSSELRAMIATGSFSLDLNDLIAPGSGMTLLRATDINDAGQIVGQGAVLVEGQPQFHAFLLTPRTSKADLSVTFRESPARARVGDLVRFLVFVTDRGPDSAKDVKLSCNLAPNLVFVRAHGPRGVPITHRRGVVTAKIGTLSPETSAIITLFVRPRRAGRQTNRAHVEGSLEDPVRRNNSAKAEIMVSTKR